MNLFVFDIETIPDVTTCRKQHNFEGLSDQEVVSAVTSLQRAQKGSDFMPLYLQRIVCISVVLRTPTSLKVWSLGEEDSTESALVERFFKGIEKYTPTLVTWNGSGFDLPVLHYRALLHGITAARYWEHGDTDTQFKYNNYLNRYHYRHLDLMDVLASYNARSFAPLDGIATMLGFPGKMGQSGAQVWPQFNAGKIKDVRNYCETDVLNTYLVYLRFQLVKGSVTPEAYQAELAFVRETLNAFDRDHFRAFVEKMPQ